MLLTSSQGSILVQIVHLGNCNKFHCDNEKLSFTLSWVRAEPGASVLPKGWGSVGLAPYGRSTVQKLHIGRCPIRIIPLV